MLVDRPLRNCHGLLAWASCFLLAVSLAGADPEIDPTTKLVKAENWELVSANCMACHSTKGFTQVRQNREGWEKTIRNMQMKNGLWPLGDMESKILDYLEKNYGLPEEAHNPKIRRPLVD